MQRVVLTTKKQTKMELKHWAAYLPYGLRVKIDLHFYKNHEAYEVVGLSETDVELADSKGNYISGTFELCDIKPILRPMSHLTKEIEHKGKKFVPIEKLKLDFNYRDNSIESNLRFNHETVSFIYDGGYTFENIRGATCPETYFMIQKLLEWHFDIFGLIEKGEAIAKE